MFLGGISIWIGGLSKAVHPPQCGYASHNMLKVWVKQKGRERKNLALPAWLLELGHLIFCPQHSWFSDLQTWTGMYITSSPGSQSFRLRLNRTICFLMSPACKEQIMGLLTSIIVGANPIKYLPIPMSYWFCFSKILMHLSFRSNLLLKLFSVSHHVNSLWKCC